MRWKGEWERKNEGINSEWKDKSEKKVRRMKKKEIKEIDQTIVLEKETSQNYPTILFFW